MAGRFIDQTEGRYRPEMHISERYIAGRSHKASRVLCSKSSVLVALGRNVGAELGFGWFPGTCRSILVSPADVLERTDETKVQVMNTTLSLKLTTACCLRHPTNAWWYFTNAHRSPWIRDGLLARPIFENRGAEELQVCELVSAPKFPVKEGEESRRKRTWNHSR